MKTFEVRAKLGENKHYSKLSLDNVATNYEEAFEVLLFGIKKSISSEKMDAPTSINFDGRSDEGDFLFSISF
jgi:hypothetical protein